MRVAKNSRHKNAYKKIGQQDKLKIIIRAKKRYHKYL
jgi:hypothetical protein